MKTKKVYVALSPEQIKALKPIFDAVRKADFEMNPGMALAQLYYNGTDGCMVAAFVDNERAEKIIQAAGGKKLEYTTGKSAIAKSKKGR